MYLFTHLKNRGNTSLKHVLGEKIHEHFQVCEEFGAKHNSENQECYTYPGVCQAPAIQPLLWPSTGIPWTKQYRFVAKAVSQTSFVTWIAATSAGVILWSLKQVDTSKEGKTEGRRTTKTFPSLGAKISNSKFRRKFLLFRKARKCHSQHRVKHYSCSAVQGWSMSISCKHIKE